MNDAIVHFDNFDFESLLQRTRVVAAAAVHQPTIVSIVDEEGNPICGVCGEYSPDHFCMQCTRGLEQAADAADADDGDDDDDDIGDGVLDSEEEEEEQQQRAEEDSDGEDSDADEIAMPRLGGRSRR